MTRFLNTIKILFRTLLQARRRAQIHKAIQLIRSEGFGGLIHKLITLVKVEENPIAYGISQESYQKWLSVKNRESSEDRHSLRKRSGQLRFTPLISVIMPTFNSNPIWLRQAIDSVLDQVYPNWELCIADDASTLPAVKTTLQKYAQKDPRIKILYRIKNGHISEASNSALSIATGDYIALLDHDDLITTDALLRIAEIINQHQDAVIIYSDEDKITPKGTFTDPYLKCSYNYTLFLQQNMISHLGVYRLENVKQTGGFRSGFEGSQDYDLALRISETCRPEQIIHIPHVLYHWRIHKNSTASTINNKTYAFLTAKKAVQEHIKRTKTPAKVVENCGIYHRVQFYFMEPPPMVSIIIPTKNNYPLLQKCIQGLQKTIQTPNIEILIIDNGSSDQQTLNYLQELSSTEKVKIISDARAFNYSALNNKAVQHAQGEYLLLLNDDTEAKHIGWFEEMLSIAILPDTGVVGARLLYPDGSIQHAGVILGLGGVAEHSHKHLQPGQPDYFGRTMLVQELSAVTGACMMVRKKVFLEAGGFDEVNLAVAFNDVDLCLKIRTLGYKVIYTPHAELLHYESYSRGNDLEPQNSDRAMQENEFMMKKWEHWIENDPAYSPNLTRTSENFSLAFPPRMTTISKT